MEVEGKRVMEEMDRDELVVDEVVEVVGTVEEVVAGLPVCDFIHLAEALLLLLNLAVVIVFVDKNRFTLPLVERRAEQIAEEGLEHLAADSSVTTTQGWTMF